MENPIVPNADAQDAPSVESPDSNPESQSNAKGSENAKPNSVSDAGEKALKKIYKVKVDGQELEVDEDQLLKDYQLKTASYKRMQDAARKEKELSEREERRKRDPKNALKELGHDPLKLAEEIIESFINEQKMSPDERRIRELEERIKAEESEKKTRQEDDDQKAFQVLQEKAAQDLDTSFTKILEQSGLPKTPYTVKRMAEKYYLALEDGIENPDLDIIKELVEEELSNDLQNAAKRLPADKLLKFLGDELLDTIRKADLARLKNAPSPNHRSAPVSAKKDDPNAGEKPKQKMDIYEWRQELERLKKQS